MTRFIFSKETIKESPKTSRVKKSPRSTSRSPRTPRIRTPKNLSDVDIQKKTGKVYPKKVIPNCNSEEQQVKSNSFDNFLYIEKINPIRKEEIQKKQRHYYHSHDDHKHDDPRHHSHHHKYHPHKNTKKPSTNSVEDNNNDKEAFRKKSVIGLLNSHHNDENTKLSKNNNNKNNNKEEKKKDIDSLLTEALLTNSEKNKTNEKHGNFKNENCNNDDNITDHLEAERRVSLPILSTNNLSKRWSRKSAVCYGQIKSYRKLEKLGEGVCTL
eukprot:Pgem_evm1s3024